MDELIEHLQLNLGKDFGYEDDVVVEKLRDVMHELRSSRLDYAGSYRGKHKSLKLYPHKYYIGIFSQKSKYELSFKVH